MVSLTGQIYAFFMTIVAGAAVGLMFDIYRILRCSLRPKRWVGWLCDVLYWLVVTPVVFLILLLGNWGELRYYVMLGMALGLFAYFQLFSSFVLWACLNLYHGLTGMLLNIGSLVVYIVLWPFRLLGGLGLGSRSSSFLKGRRHSARPQVTSLRWRVWKPRHIFRP